MVKLYFKKLLSMFLSVALLILIYYIGFSALMTASNFFKALWIRYVVLFGIPALIILVMVYRRRAENAEIRRCYLTYSAPPKTGVKQEFLYILRLADFLMELAAFATILLPFLVGIGIENQAPWWANILAGIIMFCLFEGGYFLLDWMLWLLVHNKWQRER